MHSYYFEILLRGSYFQSKEQVVLTHFDAYINMLQKQKEYEKYLSFAHIRKLE